MKNICIAGLGNKGIGISRYVSSSLNVQSMNLSSEPGMDVIFVSQEKISLIESEKISTDYDDFFINILNRCKQAELLVIIADFSDTYAISLTNVIGRFTKKLKMITMGIFIFPFKSEVTRYEKAIKSIDAFKENFDLMVIIGKDEIFKAFRDIPIKLIDNVQNELIYMIVKNIYQSLSIQDYIDIVSKSKKMMGFGVSITDRMDKLKEAFDEATSFPWLDENLGNTLIIFNGPINENDLLFLKDYAKYKNSKIKINTNNNQGRRIDVLILNF